MTEPTQVNLKHCPFCGDQARIYIDCGIDKFYSFKAVCWRETCHAQTPWHRSQDEAITAWNKRT
jgi:Lar family restriction alleviation protein